MAVTADVVGLPGYPGPLDICRLPGVGYPNRCVQQPARCRRHRTRTRTAVELGPNSPVPATAMGCPDAAEKGRNHYAD